MPTDPWFQSLFAERIGGAAYGKSTDIYKFEKIKRAKRKALADFPHRQLLDFGIGENDDMAPAQVRASLKAEADKVENRGYADNGIANYKEAAAEFLKREFGVTVDPVTEVCHCIGSKPAYAMLPAAFINPGDVTLMTVPGYPVAGTWTKYLGGEVCRLPLLAANGFLPDLDSIADDIEKRAKLLVYVAGHAKIVQAYADVKDNSDSGQFMAIQNAAAAALRDASIPVAVRAKYERRLRKLVAALKEVGFAASMPGGTYFLYVPSPKSAGERTFANAEEASQYLITEQSVCTVPWDDAGAFLRFSVTYIAKDEAEEDVLMAETVARLKGMKLEF
jgi:aspartate/methionine/tyrosine aminotransferase